MKKRNKIIIAIAIALLIILLIILFWFRLTRTQPPAVVVTVEQEEEVPPAPPRQTEEVGAPLVVDQETLNGQVSINSLAKTFSERYGSFSSESDFQNIVDLYPLMSARFQSESAAYVATAVAPDEYYGVNTKVLSVTVDSMSEEAGVASATVATQREEAKGSVTNISVKYQDIKLTFVQERGSWKVDSASWQ